MEKNKNLVFYISLILIAIIAVWSVVLNESFTKVSDACFTFLTTDFGWLYLIAMLVFLVFVVYIAFGRYGGIRLGGDDSRPEYKNLTWLYPFLSLHSGTKRYENIFPELIFLYNSSCRELGILQITGR